MFRVILTLLLLFCFNSCSNKGEKKEKDTAVKVVIKKAISKTVPYYIETIGNTEAYATVNIIPQVEGEITGYYFTDGQEVKKGDLLYRIYSRPYIAQLEESEGELKQAQASLAYQEDRVERYKKLLPDDYVSKLDFEQYVSDVLSAKGQVEQYTGSVKNAQVKVGYCTIRSPIDGLCGVHQFDPGNVVKANQEKPLVVINQLDPLYIKFTVAEKFLPSVLKYQTKEGLEIEFSVVGEENKTYKGHLDFINNEVDTRTGTIFLRGITPNEDRSLWAGQFVNLHLNLYDIPNAVMIPEEAFARDVNGTYVFIAKPDHTVEQRSVTLGQNHSGMIVIEKGLKEGEEVVVQGISQLSPGAKYKT